MSTHADAVTQALERLRDWGETIRRGDMRTVVGGGGETRGQWVGHEEFFADLAILEAALSAVREWELEEANEWLKGAVREMRAHTEHSTCECALCRRAPERES